MPKISALTAATTVNPTDSLVIVQSGTTKKAAASLIGTTARTAAEIAAAVTPTAAGYQYEPGDVRRYGGVGDGTTSDQTAWAAAIAQLAAGGADVSLIKGATHIVTAKVSLTSASAFRIHGNGATIKAQNGMTVGSGTQLLHLTGCTDFVIEDLTFDGNRANRTPAETTSHLLHLTDCQKFALRRVRADNATTDGFRFDAATAADATTFCLDFTLDDCFADNAYRNGAGFINALDYTVKGGAFTNANGTAPQAGIDVESNGAAADPGNRSGRFRGVRFSGCAGYGLQLAADDAAIHFEVDGCYFADCDLGGVVTSTRLNIVGGLFENFTASGAVGVKLQAAATAEVTADGVHFRNFTAPAAACFDDGSSSSLIGVERCTFEDVVSAVTAAGDHLKFSHNKIDTTSAEAVSIASGCSATVDDNTIIAATGRAIYSAAADSKITNNRAVDVVSVSGGYIQAEGAGNVVTFNTCEASTPQATTIGIRVHHNALVVAFNRCVNLHTTEPYSIQGTESATTALIGYNSGGTANDPKRLKYATAAKSYSDGSRPAANTVPIGGMIWNTTDNAPNFSDGTNWRDAAGSVT